MEGFKKLPKMQSFKIGGSVKQQFEALEKKERKTEEKADTAQDKAMVKKGVRQHETALHKGEPKTELKLKCGGRTKKATGTVKKFKSGGEVNNVYEAKKKSGDKDAIKAVKQIKPTKAAAPSKAAVKAKGTGAKTAKASGDKDVLKKVAATAKKAAAPTAAAKVKNTPAKFCGGKAVRKMAAGKSVDAPVDVKDPQALTDRIAREENEADARIIPDAINAVKNFGKSAVSTAKKYLTGQGAVSDKERQDVSNINKKKGGKIKKYADGGSVFTDEEKAWLGGADATDPFILARMRSALGERKPQGNYIPNANPAMDNRDVGVVEGIRPQGSYIPNANPAMDNRDVGLSVPAKAPSAPVRQVSRPSYMDNRDVGIVDQAPNVEQDSGLAYPQGRPNVNQLPQFNLPQSFTNANRTTQTNTTTPNIRETLFGSRPRMSFADRLALLNKRKG